MTLHGKKKETKKDVNTIHRQVRIMLANSFAVIGLSWGLDQKRKGTEPTLTNPTDQGIKQHRKWWQSSQDLVIQSFVSPVLLDKSIHCDVVMKTTSCFSARWFLRISSVSTEQWQISATKYPKILGFQGSQQHLIIWKWVLLQPIRFNQYWNLFWTLPPFIKVDIDLSSGRFEAPSTFFFLHSRWSLWALFYASLFQVMGQIIFFIFWSFHMSVAMRSSLLDYVFWNWKKVHRILDETSIGHCFFFQEMPVCTIDDALGMLCTAS